MNAIKIPVLITGLSLFLACSAKDPKSMARAYCACFRSGLEQPEKMNECAELAKEHQQTLGKDEQKSMIYAEEIIRCSVYDYPEK